MLRLSLMGILLVAACTVPRLEKAEINPVQAAGLILIDPDSEWLPALAAPLARHLSEGDLLPLLVVGNDLDAVEKSLNDVSMVKGKIVFLTHETIEKPDFDYKGHLVEAKTIPWDPLKAGIRVAHDYWESPAAVVIAPVEHPDALIQASVLAGRIGAPLIPITSGKADRTILSSFLKSVKVDNAVIVYDTTDADWEWLPAEIRKHCRVQVMSPGKALSETIKSMDAATIKNIIVTRIETEQPGVTYPAAFTAPYLSLVRKAPILLCESSAYQEAESKVEALVDDFQMRIRSVTIIGNHEQIGLQVTAEWEKDSYDAAAEPLSVRHDDNAYALTVGRFPFTDPAMVLGMFSRGLACERSQEWGKYRVLMFGNPQTSYGPLPLCETITRATSEEFKNCQLSVDEFYGSDPEDRNIMYSAARANLIVFEGHITDLYLFYNLEEYTEELPVTIVDKQNQKWDEYFLIHNIVQDSQTDSIVDRLPPADDFVYVDSEGNLIPDEEIEEYTHTPEPDIPAADEEAEAEEEIEEAGAIQVDALTGNPFVILQSCHSLENSRAEWIAAKGGIGILGSTTNIHSASGSAFIKAYCDSLLYRGTTAGEALRDARNYFICLNRLRQQRNHTQTAKMMRVAGSFALWGDPELRILPAVKPVPIRPVINAGFSGKRKLRIQTPPELIKEVKTDFYALQHFPSAQAGAIVTRLKGKAYRRIKPLYFFHLPVPESFLEKNFSTIIRPKDKDIRSIFITDTSKKNMYVLYYPEKEKKNGKYILEFRE